MPPAPEEKPVPSTDESAAPETAEVKAAEESRREKIDIYNYEDYRAFLRDRFLELQAENPLFSQRMLARKAAFANPGFFNEVIKGRRKLTPNATEKIATGLSLQPNETKYLMLMVEYNEAKDLLVKQAARQRLELRRGRKSFKRLGNSQARYYQDPNYPLVRAAIAVGGFQGDYDKLSLSIRPPLPVVAVKQCVRDLCEWGLVKQGRDGTYRTTHAYLEPPEDFQEILRKLNREWILQAAINLDMHPKQQRHFSSALMLVSDQAYHAILDMLVKVREQILELVKQDTNPSLRVVQFNMQLFPRSSGLKNSR